MIRDLHCESVCGITRVTVPTQTERRGGAGPVGGWLGGKDPTGRFSMSVNKSQFCFFSGSRSLACRVLLQQVFGFLPQQPQRQPPVPRGVRDFRLLRRLIDVVHRFSQLLLGRVRAARAVQGHGLEQPHVVVAHARALGFRERRLCFRQPLGGLLIPRRRGRVRRRGPGACCCPLGWRPRPSRRAVRATPSQRPLPGPTPRSRRSSTRRWDRRRFRIG